MTKPREFANTCCNKFASAFTQSIRV